MADEEAKQKEALNAQLKESHNNSQWPTKRQSKRRLSTHN